MDYEKQAQEFLRTANATLVVEIAVPQLSPRWAKDGKYGIQYSVTLAKMKTDYTPNKYETTKEAQARFAEKTVQFFFWDSIANKEKANHGISAKPKAYDILAGLYNQTDSFQDFCSNYGYSEDSREAYATYEEVKALNAKIESIFTPEQLEALQEIV